MIRGFCVFDTHTHVGRAKHSGREYSADQLLADMDRVGVDRSLVIPFPLVEDERAAHDEIGRAVLAHPDRLAGAVCLNPFQPLEAFRGEVRRCVETYGFRAMKLQPQFQPLNPISPRSDFFFETALEHGLPIVCHTGAGAPYALPSLFIVPAQKFPDLTMVLGHAGGSVYYLEAITAALACPNLVIDLSSLMPHHAAEVLAYVPPSRLMAGSDLPESQETEMTKIFSLDLSEEGKADILWNTASRVFGA
ncbi:MAG: amidohydrolase family protein [Armatimonadetes bacterium]|nr:amidohydrolase family protein [Armatimonadota bacterium]